MLSVDLPVSDILVRPGTDLGQDFLNMVYIIFFIAYFLIINLLFYATIFIYVLCVTFTLYVSIVSIVKSQDKNVNILRTKETKMK